MKVGVGNVKKMEPESSQWYPETGHKVMGTNGSA